MELRQLRYFIAVAEEMNFHRAARRLHISQPPLSRQIDSLEKELGALLFERRGGGIVLTKAGGLFLEGARRLVADAEILARETGLAGGQGPATLRVGCVGSIMYSFFPELLAYAQPRMGGLRFEIAELSTEDQAEALLSGGLDIGFLRGWAPRPGLRFLPLGEESLSLLYPARLAGKARSGGLAALAEEPFVSGSAPGLSEKIAEACGRAGFSPRKAFECGQFSSIVKLVAAGLGWSIAPAFALRKMSMEGVEQSALEDSILFGVAHRDGPLPRPVEEFLGLARSFVGEALS